MGDKLNRFRGNTQIIPGTIFSDQLNENAGIKFGQLSIEVQELILAGGGIGGAGIIPVKDEFTVDSALISNKELILNYTPVNDILQVIYNGAVQEEGSDRSYIYNSGIIYLHSSTAMVLGDKYIVRYFRTAI